MVVHIVHRCYQSYIALALMLNIVNHGYNGWCYGFTASEWWRNWALMVHNQFTSWVTQRFPNGSTGISRTRPRLGRPLYAKTMPLPPQLLIGREKTNKSPLSTGEILATLIWLHLLRWEQLQHGLWGHTYYYIHLPQLGVNPHVKMISTLKHQIFWDGWFSETWTG